MHVYNAVTCISPLLPKHHLRHALGTPPVVAVYSMCGLIGMVTVMDGPESGPFNIGNPTEFTMLELAQLVQQVVNPNVKIVYKENTADDPSRRKPDITKVSVTSDCLHAIVFAIYSCLAFAQQFWKPVLTCTCNAATLCCLCVLQYTLLVSTHHLQS